MKHLSFLFFTFLLVMFLCLSCKDHSRKKIAHLVTEWQGKEVLLPENSIFTIQGMDTVQFSTNADYKILVYVDSMGCTSCRLQLHKWKEFIAEVDSFSERSVQFLFYLSPKNVKEARYITRRDDFTYPMCVDLDNAINRMNQFPQEDMFHTFLLDAANKVTLIGNPIHNKAVRELYMKTLTGREIPKSVNTIIEVPIHKQHLGILTLGEERTISFTLNNKGHRPLVIHDVITSCGCTKVEFEKKAIGINQDTPISVTYKADEVGYFRKTITVYANSANSPINLYITGEVK